MIFRTELEYFVVDVFTDRALAGNPLAVVMNTFNLPTDKMQAIAREFNLSETTFIERRAAELEQREGVRVRIFTTQEELNFAGHPTLGTASILKLHAPEAVRNGVVTLALNVGPVPVYFEGEGLRGTMTQRDPEFLDPMEPAKVAPLLGLSEDDLDPRLPPQCVSTGTAFAIIVLRTEEALARLRVDQQAATKFLRDRGARWFYAMAPSSDKNHCSTKWRARMQFYGGEDPATGSAAGCAISYLVKQGAVASDEQIHVMQGVEIGRPSDLFLSARSTDGRITHVCVGGSTIPVAYGRITLP